MRIDFTVCTACLFLALAVLPASSARASSPVELGRFGVWKALSFNDQNGKVCFMTAKPEKQEGKFKKRGDVAFFITHWAAEKTRDVVSVSIGYTFKTGSTLDLTIDGKKYKMLTDGEMAWAEDSATDRAISTAVRKGSKLVIKGASKRGTTTTDTYTLKGSGDAYKSITSACGM